jgi:hypothetical protein
MAHIQLGDLRVGRMTKLAAVRVTIRIAIKCKLPSELTLKVYYALQTDIFGTVTYMPRTTYRELESVTRKLGRARCYSVYGQFPSQSLSSILDT